MDEVKVDVDQARRRPRGRPRSCRTSSSASASAPPQAGGDHGEQLGRLVSVVFEVVGEVGVEGDAVARRAAQWRSPSTTRVGRPGDHDRGLAAPRLVDRRVPGAPGRGAGLEPVAGDVGALSGQRRSQLLDRVAAATALASPAARGRRPRGRPRPGAGAARGSDRGRRRFAPPTASVGLVSPRSTCDSIGALTPVRCARSRSERSIPSRSARTRGPTAASTAGLRFAGLWPRHRHALYVITYVCFSEAGRLGADQDLVDPDLVRAAAARRRSRRRCPRLSAPRRSAPRIFSIVLHHHRVARCGPGARSRRSPARRR